MASQQMGDKGLAVFAFATYHQLTSGERVADVVLQDGAGHRADPDAIREIEALGLATVADGRAVFTDKGQAFLEQFVRAVRGMAKHAEQTSIVT